MPYSFFQQIFGRISEGLRKVDATTLDALQQLILSSYISLTHQQFTRTTSTMLRHVFGHSTQCFQNHGTQYFSV